MNAQQDKKVMGVWCSVLGKEPSPSTGHRKPNTLFSRFLRLSASICGCKGLWLRPRQKYGGKSDTYRTKSDTFRTLILHLSYTNPTVILHLSYTYPTLLGHLGASETGRVHRNPSIYPRACSESRKVLNGIRAGRAMSARPHGQSVLSLELQPQAAIIS